jgi:hypothetical protein
MTRDNWARCPDGMMDDASVGGAGVSKEVMGASAARACLVVRSNGL